VATTTLSRLQSFLKPGSEDIPTVLIPCLYERQHVTGECCMETTQLCCDDFFQARIISREEYLLLAKVAEEAERYEGTSPELCNTL